MQVSRSIFKLRGLKGMRMMRGMRGMRGLTWLLYIYSHMVRTPLGISYMAFWGFGAKYLSGVDG